MSEETLRPRSVTELVDAAFSLYRRDASSYIMVSAIAAVPGLLVNLANAATGGEAGVLASFGMFGVAIISLVTYALMTGVVTKLGSDVYLGGEADVAGAVRHVMGRLGALIAAGLMRGILIFLFALMLLLPALYAAARWFGAEVIVVLEGKSGSDAIGRSSDLSEDQRRHVLNTLILGYGIYFLLAIALGAIAAFWDNPIVAVFLETLVTIIAYPVVGLVTMLLYYDLRIRKEGFDVEHMARSLAATEPAR